ncbi:MAG: hypothetical protein WCI20_07315 [bacterium]
MYCNSKCDSCARIASEFTAPLLHTNVPHTRTMTFDDDNRIATFNGQNVTHDLDGNMTNGPLPSGTFTNYAYKPSLGAPGVNYWATAPTPFSSGFTATGIAGGSGSWLTPSTGSSSSSTPNQSSAIGKR